MQSLIVVYFILLYLTRTRVEATERICDAGSQSDNTICYVKETLTKISHCPNQMAVDANTNTLYFSVDSGHNTFSAAFMKLNPTKMGVIGVLKGILDAYAITSDNNNFNVYFGGNSGIYKYNSLFKTMKHLQVADLDVWWLFIRNHIYFVKFPSLKAYRYANKTIQQVEELEDQTVYQFVLDARENIFFINDTGVYGVMKNTKTPVLYKAKQYFVGIAVDNKDLVYVFGDDGISTVSRRMKLVKLLNLSGVTGMAFDKANNIIYSDSQEIARLVPITSEYFRYI